MTCSSRVLLSSIRARSLLAGKVIGLGILGLFQLLLIAVLGLAAATAAGAIEIDHGVRSPCSTTPTARSPT